LRSAVPPPRDAATRARVEELRSRLAEVKALTDTGRWSSAQEKAGPLVAQVRALGYGPLLAEALAAQGWLQNYLADLAASARSLEESGWTALGAHRDDLAAEVAAQLVGTAGYHLGRLEEAERWERLGQALLARLGGGHERAAAWLVHDRGLVNLRRGDYK